MGRQTRKPEGDYIHHFYSLNVGLAILILLVALGASLWLGGHLYPKPGTQDTSSVQERLSSVAAVYSGDTGRAAMAAMKAKAAAAAAKKVAYGGTTDGKTIFGHLCTNCHTKGVAGAPIVGNKADWAPRIAEGIPTLIKHAMNGYTGPDGNHMPAKGGNPALTKEQITNTVKWMVSQVK